MNSTDYLLIAVLVFSSLAGLMRGLLREVVSVITWVAAVWIAVTAVVRLTGGGGSVHATWYAAAMLGLVLVIDAARTTASARVARSEGSAALGANAVHFRE